MSWMEKLYQTYEAGIQLDLPLEKRLMPISHTPQNAHINIILDGDGNFLSASVLEKTQIILPATEDSASRGNIEAPHALADKLQYVAKDYADFGGQKKAYFGSYEKQLQAWCTSNSHAKVQAVLNYIQKGTVIQDLVNLKVLHVNADNKLLTTWDGQEGEQPLLFKVLPKEKGTLDQGSALVCWTVEKTGDPVTQTWKDSTIQASWIAYDTTNGGEKGLCYITGQQQPLSSKHPAKIRHSGDKAKLISSNDTSGYTYRGKFLEDNQACGIGFEVSQKAHNALGWLIQRQGFRNGDQAYIAWAVSGAQTPQPLVDEYEVMSEPAPQELDHGINLGQDYATRLSKKMAGYKANLKPNEQIIIIGIDSATPGRMGIIYYHEKDNKAFLECLEKWHNEFAWYQRYTQEITDEKTNKKTSKTTYPISSPLPKEIVKAAYGENATDNLKKQTIERLLPCIVDGLPFPQDLVQSCVRKAENRTAYDSKEQWLWEKNLGITCALYRGFRARHSDLNQRRKFEMALEENYHSRDYLYGRLLAIADSIEEFALNNIVKENRATNATRYMHRFSKNPLNTWLIIHDALIPYIERLQASEKNKGFIIVRLKALEDVHQAFLTSGGFDDKSLSGEFLLGYYCERKALNAKKDKTDNETPDDSTVTGA